MAQFPHHRESAQQGAVLVWAAVGMLFFLGLAALVIDGSYLYLTKNQLHVAADGGALAGATQIFNTSDCAESIPSSPPSNGPCASPDPNCNARRQAQQFSALHNAAGSSVSLDLNLANNSNGDIVLGNFTRPAPTTPLFTPCPAGTPVNAVRVRSRRTGESGTGIASNARVPTFFAAVLSPDFSTSGVGAFATAISGVRGDIPVCIPSCITNTAACSGSSTSPVDLTLQPDPGESIVWTSFQHTATNQNTVIPFIDGTEEIPCTSLQGLINVSNGNIQQIWNALDDAINDDAASSDGPGITVTASSPFRVVLPVCQYSCQPSPNQCRVANGYGSGGGGLPVVGSAEFNIIAVNSSNPRSIVGYFVPSVGSAGPRCSGLVE